VCSIFSNYGKTAVHTSSNMEQKNEKRGYKWTEGLIIERVAAAAINEKCLCTEEFPCGLISISQQRAHEDENKFLLCEIHSENRE
jgi:hypothetical protein